MILVCADDPFDVQSSMIGGRAKLNSDFLQLSEALKLRTRFVVKALEGNRMAIYTEKIDCFFIRLEILRVMGSV